MEDNLTPDSLDFSPEALEASIAALDQVDEFDQSLDYEKFIVFTKKEVNDFVRIVEPLQKQAVDNYGKSVYVHCINDNEIELQYVNAPFYVSAIVQNKSGKQVKPFAVAINNLKKLVTQAFSSIVLVEENNDISIALCESLLYLETINLSASVYEHPHVETTNELDKESALFAFKKLGSSLVLTERASEKNIVIDNNLAWFNTGIFCGQTKSPFLAGESLVVYKQVADILSIVAELAKSTVKYLIKDDLIYVSSDNLYIEASIGTESMVEKFKSPVAAVALGFTADVRIINDNILRLVSFVKNMSYFSEIVTLQFEKDHMDVVLATTNYAKKSTYTFNITEGSPSITGSMQITTDVLKLFLSLCGQDVTYQFNESGLGIQSEDAKILIRKS